MDKDKTNGDSFKQHKWLARLSLFLLVIGVVIAIPSFIGLVISFLPMEVHTEIGFGQTISKMEYINKFWGGIWSLRLLAFFYFLIGCLITASAVGLFNFKKWAWRFVFSLFSILLISIIYIIISVGVGHGEEIYKILILLACLLCPLIFLLIIRRKYFDICNNKTNSS